ncbi:MAG TPA: PAS domain-containing protein [Victivallales bacterium]|nr:PAS domain-containing protein [Victivallales bacterium]
MFNFSKSKEIRKKQKIKLIDFARMMEISDRTLYRWETGILTPSANDIRAISQFLNVSVSEISDLRGIEEIRNNITDNPESLTNREIYKLDKIIEEFGEGASVNAHAISNLKKTCIETQKTNSYLEKKINRYTRILDQNSSIIYVIDHNYKFRYVNRAFILMSGKNNSEDIIGFSISDIFGLNEVREIIQYERKVFEEGRPLYDEKIYIPLTNNQKTGLLKIYPFFNKDEEVSELICSIQDISEIADLIKKLEDLKSSIDLSDCTISIRELKGPKYKYISKSVEKLTGYKRNKFYNDTEFWRSIIHPDDREKIPIKEHIRNNITGRFNYRIIKKDGSIIWLESTVFYKQDTETGVFYKFSLIKDSTEKRKMIDYINLFKKVLNNVHYTVWVFDLTEHKYIFVSNSVKKDYGYPSSRYLTDCKFKLDTCIHPDYREQEKKYITGELSPSKKRTFKIIKPNDEIKTIQSNTYIINGFRVEYEIDKTKD